MIYEKKVLGSVAYVGAGTLREEFTWCWGGLIQYTNEFCLKPGEIVNWMRGNQSGQALCRNYLAATMAGDWLLMLDTDHTFEPDLLHRMLRVFNGNDLDVLSAVYTYKTFPYNPVIYGWSEKRKGYEHIVDLKHYGPGDCVQIGCAGAGTLLIRRRVFERIASEIGVEPFAPFGAYHTDDFSFFEKLRALGIKSWACPSIQTYHLRVTETSMEDYAESEMVVSEWAAADVILDQRSSVN